MRAIYQRKVDGKWAVIEVPDDYKDGDRLLLRGSTDQSFDSRDEARAELLRRATEE
jgi:NDP-sugar pyrophosphorylase family protein